MKAVLLVLVVAGCGITIEPARPPIPRPAPLAEWPPIEPRPVGDLVCLSPDDAALIAIWRDSVAPKIAEWQAWGEYYEQVR